MFEYILFFITSLAVLFITIISSGKNEGNTRIYINIAAIIIFIVGLTSFIISKEGQKLFLRDVEIIKVTSLKTVETTVGISSKTERIDKRTDRIEKRQLKEIEQADSKYLEVYCNDQIITQSTRIEISSKTSINYLLHNASERKSIENVKVMTGFLNFIKVKEDKTWDREELDNGLGLMFDMSKPNISPKKILPGERIYLPPIEIIVLPPYTLIKMKIRILRDGSKPLEKNFELHITKR